MPPASAMSLWIGFPIAVGMQTSPDAAAGGGGGGGLTPVTLSNGTTPVTLSNGTTPVTLSV
jgi:hypothetical protein